MPNYTKIPAFLSKMIYNLRVITQNTSLALVIWKNKILIFRRDNMPSIPHPDCWQLPGGGIEKEENPKSAIERELNEEVSYVPGVLKFTCRFKEASGKMTYLYTSFVSDNEADKFKLGKNEGQEIGFFTINKILSFKLGPSLQKYLSEFREQIEKAMRTKIAPKLDGGLIKI